jgi:cytochrome c-type biogenesis protein CcmH
MTRPALLLAVATTLVVGAPLEAQRAPGTGEAMTVHPEAEEAIGGLKSPYCPGLMLEVCPSPGAAELRDSIQSRAERGEESEAIIEGVLAEYGEKWRAEPLASGTGLWAWVIPPAVLLAGLGMVGLLLARRKRTPAAEVEERPVDPDQEERLRNALRQIEEEEEPVF